MAAYTLLSLIVLVLGRLAITSGGVLSTLSKVNPFKGAKPEDRVLLPKVAPHEDKCYLIEFVSDGSDHCEQMKPVVERLEKDLRTTVRVVNINRRSEFAELFECVGGNECGSLPFFYNRRTAQAVCGATPYTNLRKLATGDPMHLFHEAPQNLFEKAEYDPRRRRGIGVSDFVKEKLFSRSKKSNRK